MKHPNLTAIPTLTVWGAPNETLPTRRGRMTYKTWCVQEAERLRCAGKRAVVLEAEGMVAVKLEE